MFRGKPYYFIIKKTYFQLFHPASITLKIIQKMSYFHIAQKSSIAKQVSQILSNGTKRTTATKSQFNPVYTFDLNSQTHFFSSVRGHIFDHQLPLQCKNWSTFDNIKILTKDVEMIRKLGPDMQKIVQNLKDLAKKSKYLILWLDCDRQGEAIAFQVIQIAKKINPKLIIKRARFSAVTRTDIIAAYQNLVQPNKLESDAVNYRIQIDFRLGCAFTRYQSLNFQKKYSLKQHSPITYGPCQLPTLGFVVQRYLQIKYFESEPYYFLNCLCVLNNQSTINFKWTKKNVRQRIAIDIIYANMYQRMNGQLKGKVIKRSEIIKKKYRPYPMTTVELQKIGTDKLRLTSAKIMQIAQKLYVSGYISYPRTETNSFPKTYNLKNLIQRIIGIPEYSQYIKQLKDNNKYMTPKTGNSDDQAHSPIHPVKLLQKQNATKDQWKVYDLIARHFLACCSKDAIGKQYQTLADVGGQEFKASYLVIEQRNFLDIYPFIKWQATFLNGQIPDQFPALVNIDQNKTKPPSYLTQSNLIQTMEKNNIGTDSTIHEHIENIQKRNYAVKENNTFKPTNLGASLILAYKNLNIKLVGCQVRREIEQTMNKIARGQIDRQIAVNQMLVNSVSLYEQLQVKKKQWMEELSKAMQEHKNLANVDMDKKQVPFNSFNPHIQQERFDNRNNSNSQNSNFQERRFGNQNGFNSNFQQRRFENQSNQENVNQRGCYTCSAPDHYSKDCPQRNNRLNNNSLKQNRSHYTQNSTSVDTNNRSNVLSVKCYKCGQIGHYANKCPKLGQSNNSSFIKKNFSTKNITQNKNENNQNKRKRKCKQCGIQGRHPNNSKCGALKKNKTQQMTDDDF